MRQLLIHLQGMPADELDEIHALLQSQAIEYSETTAGTFGISVAALWVEDDIQFTQARSLLDNYAQERSQRMREQRTAELAAGTARSFAHMFAEQPVRITVYVLLVLGLFYAGTVHFLFSLG